MKFGSQAKRNHFTVAVPFHNYYGVVIMDLNSRISHLKNFALKQIEESAKKGDTASIFSNAAKVEELERLEKKFNELVIALDKVEKSADSFLTADTSFSQLLNNPDAVKQQLTPKETGRIRRKEFIQELHKLGIQLDRTDECVYKTRTNEIVGIAYASERRPNKWFLGLPIKSYHAIILLCEKKNGTILKFILPGEFLNGKKEYISNDDGNFKYNIAFRNEEFHIRIPKVGKVNVSKFLNNYASIRK